METASVISKIKKLLAVQTDSSATEHEIMNAMNRIGELMQVYNINVDQIFLSEQSCVTKIIQRKSKNRNAIDSAVVALAAFCDCKIWRDYNRSYNVFGMETDTEIFEYFYQVINKAVEEESRKFKLTSIYLNSYNRKREFVSFQYGMCNRLHTKLTEMANKRHVQESVEGKHFDINGENLSIVVIKKRKIDSEYEKLNLKLTSRTTYKSHRSYNAYDAGYDKGGSVNLNRPLNSSSSGISGLLS